VRDGEQHLAYAALPSFTSRYPIVNSLQVPFSSATVADSLGLASSRNVTSRTARSKRIPSRPQVVWEFGRHRSHCVSKPTISNRLATSMLTLSREDFPHNRRHQNDLLGQRIRLHPMAFQTLPDVTAHSLSYLHANNRHERGIAHKMGERRGSLCAF
jgi:hypothetical protein